MTFSDGVEAAVPAAACPSFRDGGSVVPAPPRAGAAAGEVGLAASQRSTEPRPSLPTEGDRRWDELRRELDRWFEDNRAANFWWRDDDAFAPIRPLLELLDLSEESRIEVALAVIPSRTVESLAEEVERRPRATIFQHGFAHVNHAAPGERAVECGGDRPFDDIMTELQNGRSRLDQLFGSRFQPILVPPWNRIAAPVADSLSELGFRGLSTFAGRRASAPLPGLVTVDAHVDVMTWRAGSRFAGETKVLSDLIAELEARRTGLCPRDEPIGLLTHHRDHDNATWRFLETLLPTLAEHPAAHWLSISAAFDPGGRAGGTVETP